MPKKNPYVKNYSNNFIPIIDGLYLLWYRFAPFYEQIARKLQASPRIPQKDKEKGYSWNHIDLTPEKIEERWKKELSFCKNILENPKILIEYNEIKKRYEN